MYTRLCSSLLFPLHERLKGHHSVALRKELERSQWLPADHLVDLQVSRLKAFLTQIGTRVPYYRDLFARLEFRPECVQSIADIATLPLLDKATIRAGRDQMLSTAAGKVLQYNTGGSSGEPLVFFMGMARVSHDVAAKWRATRWWGVDIGDAEVVLWGSPVELDKQDRVKALRDRVFRSHLLPAFEMSERQMDEYLGALQRLRPRMLFGYASALALLASHAERRGRDMTGIGAAVAFVTGETLYAHQRAVIERVFGVPAANGYGSRDAGFIAHQCPSGSLHISAEHIVVELLDESGSPVPLGKQGEIVVTHLATGDFPFVRYRTGDMAVAEAGPCACGRGLPVLREVLGRSTDFIRTPSGNVMHALALIYEIRDKPGVKAFKFVQDRDYSVALLVTAGCEFTADVERQVQAGLARRLGDQLPVSVHRVDHIQPEKSGKYRYVVSRVDECGEAS